MRVSTGLLVLIAAPLLAGTTWGQEAGADLRMLKLDFEEFDRIEVGDPVSYVLNVTNLGPGRATGVVVVDRFPESFEVVDLPSECALTMPNVVTCDFPDLGPGDLAAFTLTLRPTIEGTFTNVAEVTSAAADPDPSNNVAAEETTVGSGAPGDVECLALESGVQVSWRGRAGAEYRVQRAEGEGAFATVGTTRETSFLDGSVAANTTYRYRVTATFGGVESAPSEVCEVTTIPFFGGWATIAFAAVGAVGAYALLRRRRA